MADEIHIEGMALDDNDAIFCAHILRVISAAEILAKYLTPEEYDATLTVKKEDTSGD